MARGEEQPLSMLEQLPEPVLAEISYKLPARTLASAECASRTLRSACCRAFAWRTALARLVGSYDGADATARLAPLQCYKQACAGADALTQAARVQVINLLRRCGDSFDVSSPEIALSAQMDGDNLFDCVYKLMFELLHCPKQQQSVLVHGFFDVLERIALELPHVLHDFAWKLQRFASEYSDENGFFHWPEVPWRRSALQFMLECLEERSSPAQAVAHQLRYQVDVIDETIQSAAEEAIALVMPAPLKLPQHHLSWWNPVGFQMGASNPLC